MVPLIFFLHNYLKQSLQLNDFCKCQWDLCTCHKVFWPTEQMLPANAVSDFKVCFSSFYRCSKGFCPGFIEGHCRIVQCFALSLSSLFWVIILLEGHDLQLAALIVLRFHNALHRLKTLGARCSKAAPEHYWPSSLFHGWEFSFLGTLPFRTCEHRVDVPCQKVKVLSHLSRIFSQKRCGFSLYVLANFNIAFFRFSFTSGALGQRPWSPIWLKKQWMARYDTDVPWPWRSPLILGGYSGLFGCHLYYPFIQVLIHFPFAATSQGGWLQPWEP